MTEKDKLSKEVEEKIQNLANEVYIQIEEKLTQFITTVTPKKIIIEQAPAYLALQNNYLISQDELAEKNRNLSEQIDKLEQNTTTLKEQLADEIDKKEGSELNFQVELTQNTINFTETIERLEHENNRLKSTLTQEQEKLTSEQQGLKTEFSGQKTSLNKTIENLEQVLSVQKTQLQQEQAQAKIHNQQSQSQIASNEKALSAQEQEIAALNEKLTAFSEQEQRLTEQQLADKNENDKQHQKVQEVSQQQIDQLEIKNHALTNNLITEQADIKLYQKEVFALKSELTLAQEGHEKILNRFNAIREKQEKDNNQVRETIKYLRDENNDMITQNNSQKEVSVEKINELEHKLTEYRLKFEYAQKQLTQNS